MPGPPPTPTTILAARGSHRAKSRKSEPEPSRAIPICPDHLSDDAKREWERLVKILGPIGLLTIIDGGQLALCCVALSRWAEAERELAVNGCVIVSPNGYPIQNPWLAISNKAMEQVHAYLAKFGMNPADRARVQVATESQPKPQKTESTPTLRIAQ